MAESQSRYSIVADLTKSKLDIITAKSNLENETKLAQQKVTQLKEDLKDWELGIKDEQARQKREKERNIKQAEREAKNAEDRKKSKEDSYNSKLKAIEDSLKDIKSISEAAAKESSH
jgi:hypothetical protein